MWSCDLLFHHVIQYHVILRYHYPSVVYIKTEDPAFYFDLLINPICHHSAVKVCICVCLFVYLPVSVCACACMCVFMPVHMCLYVYACVFVYVCV